MRLIASLLSTAPATEIVDHGQRWRLADTAPIAANRPLLIVTAARELVSSQARARKAALTARHTRFDSVEIDSNHSFYDHRTALESDMLAWLDKLPGASRG